MDMPRAPRVVRSVGERRSDRVKPPKYNERRGDHVWTEGDRTSPVKAMRSDYWSYEPIGNVPNYRTNPKEAPQ